MKRLLPLIIALVGLGAGVGAGIALKPAPEEHAAAAEGAAACAEHSETPCTAEAAPDDPFEHAAAEEPEIEGEPAYVPLEKPFVVPIFAGEKVVAMIVLSLSVATDEEGAHAMDAVQPRLRDSFLKVMFRHANSGGFDGLLHHRAQDGRPEVGAARRRARGDARRPGHRDPGHRDRPAGRVVRSSDAHVHARSRLSICNR